MIEWRARVIGRWLAVTRYTREGIRKLVASVSGGSLEPFPRSLFDPGEQWRDDSIWRREGNTYVAEVDGFDVQVRASAREGEVSMVVNAQGKFPADMRIAPRRLGSQLLNVLARSAPRVTTGDEAFDAEVNVWGEVMEIRARLDGPARELIRRALAGTRTVVEFWDIKRSSAGDWRSNLAELLEVAKALTLACPLTTKLAHNAAADPEPMVRLENLRLLVASFPGAAGAALGHAVNDADLRVRREAVLVHRTGGSKHLARLCADAVAACRVNDEPFGLARETAAAIALEALDRLHDTSDAARPEGRPPPRERLLGELLEVHRGAELRAAVALAGRHRVSAVLPDLRRLVENAEPDVAEQLAVSLCDLAGAGAEGDLLRLLEHWAAPAQIAAASLLGRVGSERAVKPLLECARVFDFAVEAAAKEAIRSIQARLEGAEHGQLSLAEPVPQVGALGLDGAEQGGQLALAPSQISAGGQPLDRGVAAPAEPDDPAADSVARPPSPR